MYFQGLVFLVVIGMYLWILIKQAYMCEGDVFMAMEEYDAAEKSYSTCLQIDPSIRRSKSFKVYFNFLRFFHIYFYRTVFRISFSLLYFNFLRFFNFPTLFLSFCNNSEKVFPYLSIFKFHLKTFEFQNKNKNGLRWLEHSSHLIFSDSFFLNQIVSRNFSLVYHIVNYDPAFMKFLWTNKS